jgi:hypothetical protein
MQQMFTLKTPQLVQTVSVFSIILVSLLVCMNVVVGFIFGYVCMIINLEMVPIQMNVVSVRKNGLICLYAYIFDAC